MDAAFHQKMYVNRHFGAGGELEGRGVAARGKDFTLAQPARAFKRWARAAYLIDEERRIVPVLRPAGADERDVARIERAAGRFEVGGRDNKIIRQRGNACELRDVEENAAAEDGLDVLDGVSFDARSVSLDGCGFLASEQTAIAGEMAERVYVSADMRAQRDGLGSRTRTTRIHVVPVLLVQAEEERGVGRVVRDAGVVRLGQIDGAKLAKGS